jgi:hypothetical protein
MGRLKIEISVPDDYVLRVIEALEASGAGRIGNYESCTSVWRIAGTWRPMSGSQPHNGEVEIMNYGTETRIESVCDADRALHVLRAVRAAHPYEEPVIRFLPLYEPPDGA